MISMMKLIRSLEVTHLQSYSDSQLVVEHFSGEYDWKIRKVESLHNESEKFGNEIQYL